MFQVRQTSAYNLTCINQQLALLKEKMIKEQKRLNTLIEKKDEQIKSQNDQILNLRNMSKSQQSKRADTPEKSGISIRIADSSKLSDKTERLHDFYAHTKSYTTSLRRQPKFTK